MNRSVSSLCRLIALVWLALGMCVPVSAWTIHEAAHGAAQVSVDVHHQHDSEGAITTLDPNDGETPDGGHDHMPTILLGAVTVPDAGIALAAPSIVRATYTISRSPGVERHTSDGLRRPPRLG